MIVGLAIAALSFVVLWTLVEALLNWLGSADT